MLKKCSYWTSQKGYTLVNTLVAFSIFLILVSFLPLLIKNLKLDSPNQIYQTILFFDYVHKEIVQAKQLSTSGTTLYLTKYDGTNVRFEKYNSNIRRRVNGVGNEIYLQKVEDINYQVAPNGVIISVKMTGTVFEKRLSMAPQLY